MWEFVKSFAKVHLCLAIKFLSILLEKNSNQICEVCKGLKLVNKFVDLMSCESSTYNGIWTASCFPVGVIDGKCTALEIVEALG